MNELGLNRLLWCYDECGLGCTGDQTTAEIVKALLIWKDVFLCNLEGTETNIVFWDGKHEQGTVSSVEAEEAALLHCLLC